MSDSDTTELETYDEQTDIEPADEGMRGPNEYDPMEIYDLNRHRVNGDETVVVLSSFGRGYQAYALDVDKAGEILEVEVIGDAEDRQRAESMCEFWVQQNPKGIMGASEGDDESGGGLGEFLGNLGLGGDGK